MSSFAVIAAVAADDDLANAQILSWDLQTGVPLPQHIWREAAVLDATLIPSRTNPFMPAHMLSTAIKTSALHTHMLQKERPVARWYGHERVCCVGAGPCGRWLAAGNEGGGMMVWELETGRMAAHLTDAHLRKINRIRFSRDGAVIVTVSDDGFAKVWALESLLQAGGVTSAAPLFAFNDHSSTVVDFCIGFGSSFRSCRLITCSSDGSCNMYDLADGACLARYKFPSPLTGCLMNATETMIFAASTSGDVYLVDLGADSHDVTQDASVKISEDSGRREQKLASMNGSPITRISLTLEESTLVTGDASGTISFWNIAGRMTTRQIGTGSLVPGGSIRWLEIVPKAALTRAEPLQTFGQLRRAFDAEGQQQAFDTILHGGVEEKQVSSSSLNDDQSEEVARLREENAMLKEAHRMLLESIQESF